MTPSKYITVAYRLYAPMEGNEKELIEEATEEYPFQFVTGLKMTLDRFEEILLPLQKGDKFDFTLSIDEAYGPFEEERVVTLPKKTFEINGRIDSKYIYEGAVVPLTNPDGERFNGTISQITDSQITVDLNHPLAGKPLTFQGVVTESREATPEEIQDTIKFLSGEGCCGGHCGGDCEGRCGGGGCQDGCGNCK